MPPEMPIGFQSETAPLAMTATKKAKEVKDEVILGLCPADGSMDCKKLAEMIRLYESAYGGEDWSLIQNPLETKIQESAIKLEGCFSQVFEKFNGYQPRAIAEKVVSFCSREIRESVNLLPRRSGASKEITKLTADHISDDQLTDALELEIKYRKLFPKKVEEYRRSLGY